MYWSKMLLEGPKKSRKTFVNIDGIQAEIWIGNILSSKHDC
jgi:hypothetical protein